MDYQSISIDHNTWTVNTERYSDLEPIGQGAYGAVCSAYDSVLERHVAIKKLTKPFQTKDYGKRTYREVRLLKHMDHENIVCLVDIFSPQSDLDVFSDLYLVTPLMSADLHSIIRNQSLDSEQVMFLVYQILRALKYLHSADIIHRDLKPSNIAVNEECELKILDFGLARQRQGDMTGYVATRWYRAPDVLLQWCEYDASVDIWSVGCIMGELLTGTALFMGDHHLDQIKRIFKVTGRPSPELLNSYRSEEARAFILNNIEDYKPIDFNTWIPNQNDDTIDLLKRMLTLDPSKRITAQDALEHPYCAIYHDESDEPIAQSYSDPREDEGDIDVDKWKRDRKSVV